MHNEVAFATGGRPKPETATAIDDVILVLEYIVNSAACASVDWVSSQNLVGPAARQDYATYRDFGACDIETEPAMLPQIGEKLAVRRKSFRAERTGSRYRLRQE